MQEPGGGRGRRPGSTAGVKGDGSQVPSRGRAVQEAEPERSGGGPESFHPGHPGQWGGRETGKARHLLVTVVLVNRGRSSGMGSEEPKPDSHHRS